ncbi:MAG: type I-B CRISPR-associated protein Cas5b [Candidatus Calescibacterium sp.]|nr:type I-B CRISPR-associated protein Cas5b [Candidatus Calescibacterium sp.]
MKLTVLDIFSEYGHFRKYWTTTSPLTFNFIPPTTVYGIISAIIGIDKSEYLDVINYNTLKVAQRIMKPISKTRVPINLVDTKDNIKLKSIDSWHIKNRTQIRFEFLKDPHYRLYLLFQNQDLSNRLEQYLRNKNNFYTISMGLSELIADFNFLGSFNYSVKTPENYVDIDSVIPLDSIKEIYFEENKSYVKERVAVDITPERKVKIYKDILVEVNSKSIKCIPKEYIEIEELKEKITLI